MALGDEVFQGGAPGWKNDPPKTDDPFPQYVCRGRGEGRDKKEGGPRGPWVHPSLSGMMCLSVAARVGMVSFPARSSLRPGYLLRQSKAQKAR